MKTATPVVSMTLETAEIGSVGTGMGAVKRRQIAFIATLGALVLLWPWLLGPLVAADHIDGPVTVAHPVADISDLYAFPNPETPGRLILGLAVHPLVARDGHFSDKVNYNLIVRKAVIAGTGLEASFDTTDEFRFSCTFETPHDSGHSVNCAGPSGSSVRAEVDDTGGGESSSGLRVFAGRRSDSFFFNLKFSQRVNSGALIPPKDSNVMEDMNALAIVLDIDVAKVFGPDAGSLFAVAAETTTKDSGASQLRRIDRLGRPEMTNVWMVPQGDQQELRDLYNKEEPFNVSKEKIGLYRTRLLSRLAFYDDIDGNKDWPPDWAHVLIELLLNDFLVVDISKPFTRDTYFGFEYSILRSEPHTRCGGRTPDDDVMDVIYTLLINGGHGRQVRDGVDEPTRLIGDSFPYLPEPNNGIFAAVKAWFARRAVK